MYQKKGPRNRERDKIIIEHYQNEVSLVEIGKIFNISKQRVQQILVRNGIERRSRSYSYKRKCNEDVPKELLEKLYLDEKKSMTEICEELGIDREFVKLQLDFHNIQRRTPAEQARITIARRYSDLPNIPKKELKKLYIKKKYTRKQLAQHFGCTIRLIDKRLRDYNLKKIGI